MTDQYIFEHFRCTRQMAWSQLESPLSTWMAKQSLNHWFSHQHPSLTITQGKTKAFLHLKLFAYFQIYWSLIFSFVFHNRGAQPSSLIYAGHVCRFSGLTAGDLEKVTTTLRDIQAILLSMFSDKTILIGHSLESDFTALKVLKIGLALKTVLPINLSGSD